MAKKITDLVADTAPTSDDLVETVNDPGGTPGSRKATLANLSKGLVLANIPTVAFGVYTPVLTNVANVAASTAYQCQYMRVGSVVHVTGKVDVDPTATSTLTQLGISLPIASNIVSPENVAGTAAAPGIAGQSGAILGDAVNDRAQLQWMSNDITNQAMYFSFSYTIQ